MRPRRSLRRPAAALGGRRGRPLRTAAVAVLAFGVGYTIAASWLFPSPRRPRGGRLVELPGLVGLPVPEAERRVRELGLTPEVSGEIDHPEATPGTVVAQSPLPGQPALAGAPVRLTVSRGPEVRRVPDLRGLSARQATLVLERLGFSVRTRPVPFAPTRGVQGSRPPPGEEIFLPAEVELLVGEGPRLVVVPELEGLHIDDLEGVLRDAGLRLGSVRYDPGAPGAPGRVVAQSPPAGYSLREGGFVSVEVAGPPGGEETGRERARGPPPPRPDGDPGDD